jgi:hypothetical protein
MQVLNQKYPFLSSTRIHQNGPFQKSLRLARLADIRQSLLQGLARLAHICQAFCKNSPDSPTFTKDIFEKNVTRFAKFARVMRESGKWHVSGHCLIKPLPVRKIWRSSIFDYADIRWSRNFNSVQRCRHSKPTLFKHK